MDLSLLGAALASDESKTLKVEATAAAVLGITALDVFSARKNAESGGAGVTHFRKTITINRSPRGVWVLAKLRKPAPFHAQFGVGHGPRTDSLALGSKGPAGQRVEWDAVILEDVPNHLISWRSVEGSDVDNAGAVRFEAAPGQLGTIVQVDISYRPPGGKLGKAVAKIFGKAPDQEVQGDLARFKQVMETGHVRADDDLDSGRKRSTSSPEDDLPRN
jgi:hypothetical protein